MAGQNLEDMRELAKRAKDPRFLTSGLPAWMERSYGWFRRNLRTLFVAALVVSALVLFSSQLRAAAVIGVLGVLAVFSKVYKRYVRLPPAIELVTFGTVMVTLAYGPLIGAVFGVITTVLSEIASGYLDAFVVVYIPSEVAAAFAAQWLWGAHVSILWIGVGATLAHNAVSQPFYMLFGGTENKIKGFYFLFMNFLFNFALFLSVGQLALNIIL